MAASPSSPSTIDVFYSYAHKDERLLGELIKHLTILKRQGVIRDWHDRKITAGTEWQGQIDHYLDTAGVILLLISADFLASDYCYDIELKRAMERHDKNEARVIPVILRPVHGWQDAPFGKLQAAPTNGKPVTRWADLDEAFADVAGHIRRVTEEAVGGTAPAPVPFAARETQPDTPTTIGRPGPLRPTSLRPIALAAAGVLPALGLVFWLVLRDAPTPGSMGPTPPAASASEPPPSQSEPERSTPSTPKVEPKADLTAAEKSALPEPARIPPSILKAKTEGTTAAQPPEPPPPAEEFTNAVGMTLVRIEPGTFTMGTTDDQVGQLLELFPNAEADGDKELFKRETPAHPVRITRPFYLGKHEVMVGQFRRFVEANPTFKPDAERDGMGASGWDEAQNRFPHHDPRFSWKDPGFPQDARHPVVNVSWNDAVMFCKWLTSQDPGWSYRLPTEAEWEYACRAGTRALFGGSDDPESLAKIGNVVDASAKRKYKYSYSAWRAIQSDDGFVYTAPVGSFGANAWGLHDMIGNVWEWCQGGYGSSYQAARGGNWHFSTIYSRPAINYLYPPDFRFCWLGFRVAATRAE